jgi:hypothetical protein
MSIKDIVMDKIHLKNIIRCACLLTIFRIGGEMTLAQTGYEMVHTRGKIWETVQNDGWIGSLGAWDFYVSTPIGMYPGFDGYMHPVGSEFAAENTFANANMHNFRSGVWILIKDLMTPGLPPSYTPTPTEYETFLSGHQTFTYGEASSRAPMVKITNFIEHPEFNPLLPEEMIDARWHTNTGITVIRRSSVWSFPGFRDFIIYDYTFKNTGQAVSIYTKELVEDFMQQTLRDVYFAFHSGVSVSTKGQINFHWELKATQAGAFGWEEESYRNYYHLYDDGELVFSTNYNGGAVPIPWDPYGKKSENEWKSRFGDELMDPAAFGWLTLYASPTGAVPRQNAKPDILRIDSHKGGIFQGRDLNLEKFRFEDGITKKMFYDFVTTPGLQEGLGNNGNRMNITTHTYGPYTIAPGDSVRIIIAEIAGVMDYTHVIAGDPENHFPDSTIAAILRNAENARIAVSWGIGATVNGIPIAADVPEPPPSPVTDAINASFGTENAAIAVTWNNIAETTALADGSGGLFYDGQTDLDGYRIYRSTDFQYTSEAEPPAFRGAAWNLVRDIPISEAGQYWDTELNSYKFTDEDVSFGRRYGYYVSAYSSSPRTWTSANGTSVDNLPELESGDVNRSMPTAAAPGPVESFDIFVVPNPFVFNDENRSFGMGDPYRIEFRNLPESAQIRIYTLMGDLIRQIDHGPDERGNVYGSVVWDQKSESGLLVAPGLYIYHVLSKTAGIDKSLTGKLMIIR